MTPQQDRPNTTLAIFDLDNTLLNGDSDHAWGEFMVERGMVDADYYRRQNDEFYEAYKRGNLNIMAYLEFALEPLTRFSNNELALRHDEFMQTRVAGMRQRRADELITWHRSQGHLPMIITATNRFVTGPIANALGIDVLLATEPETIGGTYTGKVAGIPCFQHGKVERLHAWLEKSRHSLQGSYFYSDSINDLPLLLAVSHPVAVDPDERLRHEAGQRGWQVISLRDGAP